MNGGASPLNITPKMSNSNSPRSNLTSALQEAGASGAHNGSQMQYLHQNDYQSHYGNGQSSDIPRNDSINNMFGSYYGNGAKPISMRDRQRRESNNAGSFMGGMSWGASSINGGDWVRDE
jgi:transcription factor SFP1